MGAISLVVAGGSPPYNVVIRELSEISGNRCTSCTGVTSLENLPVNYIADGQPHTYLINVSNGDCHDGISQTIVTCSCANIPTLVASYLCDPETALSITPTIVGGGLLRVIVMQGVYEYANELVTSGSTLTLMVGNGATFEISAEVPDLPTCKSNVQVVTTNCEDETCTLSVTVNNPTC